MANAVSSRRRISKEIMVLFAVYTLANFVALFVSPLAVGRAATNGNSQSNDGRTTDARQSAQTALAAQTAQAAQEGWKDKSLPPDRRADLVIEQMTLDEKIQLVHGAGGFGPPGGAAGAPGGGGGAPGGGSSGGGQQVSRSNGGAGWIPGIPRLGIPDINMADSAVGVTRGAARSRYSTGLPSAIAGAATWDLQLAYLYGSVIGRELRDQGYNMSIGGGVNITREPRNGRNFEYQGEDPILAGKMIGQLMKGVQDQQIMGDIKHYALNDQETGRNIGNVVLDKRSMRETDLLAFEIGLRDSQAAGIMCSYNKVNGDWACENDYLLNQVLKKSLGFKGWVLSDWGGTHSTTKAAKAGLDQEMPGSAFFSDALKKAVESGEVPMARLDDMVHRILRSMFAVGVIDNPPVQKVVDVFRGLDDARHIAEESIVLLRNSKNQLPLDPATVRSIAVIGSHADVGVLSGGGSAQVDPPGGNAVPPAPGTPGARAPFGRVVYYPSSPLKAIRTLAANARVEFDAGTDVASAASLAKRSEIAIVFANQPTSEGRDSRTLSLPDDQDALVSAVAAANPRTIVVLETGGPVSMPWINNVAAILEGWYPGISGAPAIANILFGVVSPSGKLPVTFPKSDQDLPHPEIAGINLQPSAAPPGPGTGPGGGGGRGRLPAFEIPYTEALKVGYKWFDAEKKDPLFPFGFGLSYTTFAYSGLTAKGDAVTFTVKNTGKRAGAEIAQVYAGLPASAGEPPRRLVGWTKVHLGPGEAKTVTVNVDPLFLSIFDADKDRWELLPGEYQFFVGGSSRSTPLAASVQIPAGEGR